MVKNVIKRDGSIERFDAEKLNRWGEWAADNNVGWPDVLLEAIRSFPDSVSSEDIQNTLISVCINRRDTAHSRMAARLLMGLILKEAYESCTPPKFRDFYHSMVGAGYWMDMGYTEEELEYVGSKIIHDRDFGYEFCTIRQFYDKYSVSAYGRCLESPQMAAMATAMANTRFEENRAERAVEAYEELSLLTINLPTPSLAGQRTPLSGSPSCCVITGGDSVDSIEAAVHVAYKMTAMGSGIGAELETRSKKDPVKNGTIEHMGKDGYYRYLDRAVKSNKQATRGGSATVTFHVHDPEVDMLLRYKSQRILESQRIDSMDYSLAVTKLFMRKAARNEDWMLISVYFAPELYRLSYTTDEAAYEAEYDRLLASNVKKTVVRARDILNLFWTQRSDTGRIYRTNLTNINKHTPFKDPIRISNLCVAPETVVLTDAGNIQICELEGQRVNVWNGEEWSAVDVVKTGENQKLIRVVTDSGYELECTPYHKMYVVDSYHSKPREVRAGDLQAGDKLIKFDLPVIEGEKTLDKAYINGFYTGDGCRVGGRQRIYLYGEKKSLVGEFSGSVNGWVVQDDQDRMYTHFDCLKNKFFVPDADYTIASRLEWLAGYADADGCIYRNGDNQQLVVASVEYEFLRELQMMLQTLGVSAKIKKMVDVGIRNLPLNDGSGESGEYEYNAAWRLIITSCDLYRLLELGIRFRRLKCEMRLPQRDAKHFVKVVCVEDSGRVDDTYCLTEPKRHMAMFNGILTGQCQEIALPTAELDGVENLFKVPQLLENGEIALCFLASIVAGRMPVTDAVGTLCVESYIKTAYQTCKFVDNTIDQCTYPFAAMEYTAKNRRSIGIGLTDVAHYMARYGYKYDTIEGRNALHRLAELHSYALHKASVRLAKERGACAWIDRTKYADDIPWLPIDTYEREIDKHHTQELLCDWEGLREEIKQYGVRFSVHEAFMPVESSSVYTASTNSILPVRELRLFKKSPKGTVYFEAPGLSEFGDRYQNAYDIDPMDMAVVYGIFQKFCGQSISADFYQDLSGGKEASMSDFYKLDFFCTSLGMKTYYYLNTLTKPRVAEEVKTVTVDPNACEACTL